MRVIQVGIGDWGVNWALTVVPQVAGIEIVAFVNRQPSKVAEAASRLNVLPSLFFRSISEAAAATGAEAALVLTTTDAHPDLVTEALQIGLHVLVEKPFTSELSDARRLTEIAREARRVLMVNQNFRYYPAAVRAREIVRKQELGLLGDVRVDFRRRITFESEARARWHQTMVQPLLLDMGIHHFDLMRMIIGAEPTHVDALASSPIWSKYSDPASASALIRFANGVVVNWSGSWITRAPETTFSGDWRMEFENGCVDWCSRGDRDVSLNGERLQVRRGETSTEEELATRDLFGRAAVLADFQAAVVSGQCEDFFPSAEDNVKSLELAHLVLQSAMKTI
ncbi:Gfo/Idh/MocA family oxidoreductase [Sinorhizobium sp. 7-81]|uniref:Gfo/Idh/MocA family protein n=1 Tax=Sinorhizobium sp. 8-89 TaxID=3049089 RepID=UPI0024C394E6|nr:Gfo/Idh/MocA family oxidoreductase [Sinorhizobium sp. 8-89]MDK1493680.1 Gfo/Idh/MocA family oxidoreductase [Sinorhizobium sp. 8-89]